MDWRATGSLASRGSGAAVPTTDVAAFTGDVAPARATGLFAGEEFGFAFRSHKASTDDSYAQIGRTRNGVFL